MRTLSCAQALLQLGVFRPICNSSMEQKRILNTAAVNHDLLADIQVHQLNKTHRLMKTRSLKAKIDRATASRDHRLQRVEGAGASRLATYAERIIEAEYLIEIENWEKELREIIDFATASLVRVEQEDEPRP